MILHVTLDHEAVCPRRAHDEDAGLDLFSREDKIVPARGSAVFDTGVHMEIPLGYAGIIISKSGLNVKHNILSDGLIDPGYTGSITVKIYNHGDEDYSVRKGDKISQIVLVPACLAVCAVVEEISGSSRGVRGFGSTGR